MTDNEILLHLQDRALTGDSNAWRDLWLLAWEVEKRIFRGEIKKKRLYTYRQDVDVLALDAVSIVLMRYKKSYKSGKKWLVRKNYISTLKSACIQTLYHRTKSQKCEQLAIAYMKEGMALNDALTFAKRAIEAGGK